ncbi:hypothetical protein [Sorangium sp. So ce1153]|uniref:hypothetical protein n=1 Tax=Sorangium sp. So ce1153 TaxID=3133333 RepID=UPI003F63B7E0
MSKSSPPSPTSTSFPAPPETRAGAHHAAAREALLRYVLRPPIAKERVEPQQDGLVRLSLKRAFADGTVAVDMDPLSTLSIVDENTTFGVSCQRRAS